MTSAPPSELPSQPLAALRASAGGWLRAGRPTVVAGAPGRLDVMGGIADYSGAVVLEATIGELALVALQRRTDGLLRARTAGPETGRLAERELSLPLASFFAEDGSTLRSYDDVCRLFPPAARWAAYVLGVFYVLLAEGVAERFSGGADLLLHSTVPLGAGVASSAAIEVAAMRAVCAAYDLDLPGLRLAELCQMVENRVVGAPCGIMDQVTCTLGQAGRLLALRCQPHDVLGWPAAPPGAGFLGLDSGVKHAVGGQRYPRVRCAAFMGRAIIAALLRTHGENPQRASYLCNLTPVEYRARFRDLLPARLCGQEFLARWGQTGDPATAVDPELSYPVRGATEHAIYENARVRRFQLALSRAGAAGQALDAASHQQALVAAGRLMYGSHRRYNRGCGLGSRETDLLVSLVRRQGAAAGLFGAKITGGGSGGTVAVLYAANDAGRPTRRAAQALDEVSDGYARHVGRRPRLIGGSANGAMALRPMRLSW